MINQISTISTTVAGKRASKPFDLDAAGLAAMFCLPLTLPPPANMSATQETEPAPLSPITADEQGLPQQPFDPSLPPTLNGSQKVLPAMDEIFPDSQTSAQSTQDPEVSVDEALQQSASQTLLNGESVPFTVGDTNSMPSQAGFAGQFAPFALGQKAPLKYSILNLEVGSSHSDNKAKVPDQSIFFSNATSSFSELAESRVASEFKQILSTPPEIEISVETGTRQKEPASFLPDTTSMSPGEQTIVGAKEIPQSATSMADLGKAVAAQIERNFITLAGSVQMSGEKRLMRMRLHPAELGNVDITIEKNSSGAITARFLTESEQTRQILTQGLDHLRTALEQAGFQVAELNISHDASLAAGCDAQKNSPQNFGRAEQRSAPDGGPEGVLIHEDDRKDRLVNLRA